MMAKTSIGPELDKRPWISAQWRFQECNFTGYERVEYYIERSGTSCTYLAWLYFVNATVSYKLYFVLVDSALVVLS